MGGTEPYVANPIFCERKIRTSEYPRRAFFGRKDLRSVHASFGDGSIASSLVLSVKMNLRGVNQTLRMVFSL